MPWGFKPRERKKLPTLKRINNMEIVLKLFKFCNHSVDNGYGNQIRNRRNPYQRGEAQTCLARSPSHIMSTCFIVFDEISTLFYTIKQTA